MEPMKNSPRGASGTPGDVTSTPKRADRNTQGNFGFDASAWDPVGVLAAQIEERFQRRIRRRVEEVLRLLRQVVAEAASTSGSQEVQALAFCLVDALITEAGVSAGTRNRLLQMVACHAFPVGRGVWAGEPPYWFYLNLTLKRFRQSRAEEGLELAVRGALCGCSPLLRGNPQVTRELAAELLDILAAGGRDATWRTVSPTAEPQGDGAAGRDCSAPPGNPISRGYLRPLVGQSTSSCAPQLSAGTSET